MKKIKPQIIPILASIFLVWIIWSIYLVKNENTARLENNWTESTVPYSNNVVCNLKLSSAGKLDDGKIKMFSQKESEPLRLTFSSLNTNNPFIIGNLWDKVSLVRIDNRETLYLLEQTGAGNVNVFTLFRDKNIMTLSKQYSMFWEPFSLLMIGDCIAWTFDSTNEQINEEDPNAWTKDVILQEWQQINPDYLR